jgi:hypothetical protein
MSTVLSVNGGVVSVAGAAPVSEEQLQRSSLLARLRESDGSAHIPLLTEAIIIWQKVVESELDARGLSTQDACALLEARLPAVALPLLRSHHLGRAASSSRLACPSALPRARFLHMLHAHEMAHTTASASVSASVPWLND